jgi:DNA-binding LytR/AlgR family response regulator
MLEIAIVEDEQIIIDEIIDDLKDIDCVVVFTTDNYNELIDYIEKQKPNLILLDINIKGVINGIGIAEELNSKYSIPFIFLTSHSDFETIKIIKEKKAMGYLSKPYKKTDLLAMIELNHEKLQNNTHINISQTKEYILNNHLYIKDNASYTKIEFITILFFESDGNYINIQTESKKYIIRASLTEIEQKLPQEIFIKSHRSFVINLQKIQSISNHEANLGSYKIPISRRMYDKVLDSFFSI